MSQGAVTFLYTDWALADHCARLQIIFTYLLTYSIQKSQQLDRHAENAEYKERTRKNALRNTHKRLDNDAEYRERNRQAALLNTRRRLDTNENYAEKNRVRAANRHKQLS